MLKFARGLFLATIFGTALSQTVLGAPLRQPLQITAYVINADLDPATNKLTATAAVSFTALEDLTTATFELNNGLAVTQLTDASKKPLQSERLSDELHGADRAGDADGEGDEHDVDVSVCGRAGGVGDEPG